MMGPDKPDLEAVIRHYGGEVTGLHGNRLIKCVVHDDSVASMSVHLDKGLAQCFSCQFRGDSLTLIMQKESCDFPTAVRFAETHFGYVGGASAQPGRVGLSGEARPARGGYKPAFRKRPGLPRP